MNHKKSHSDRTLKLERIISIKSKRIITDYFLLGDTVPSTQNEIDADQASGIKIVANINWHPRSPLNCPSAAFWRCNIFRNEVVNFKRNIFIHEDWVKCAWCARSSLILNLFGIQSISRMLIISSTLSAACEEAEEENKFCNQRNVIKHVKHEDGYFLLIA